MKPAHVLAVRQKRDFLSQAELNRLERIGHGGVGGIFQLWIKEFLVVSLYTQNETSERCMLVWAESRSNFKDLEEEKKAK